MLSGVATDQEALALIDKITAAELLRIVSLLQQTISGFVKSASRRVDAELCILRLCDPSLDLDAQALNARLSKLEDRLSTGDFTVPVSRQASAAQEDDDVPPPPDDDDVPPEVLDSPAVPAMKKPDETPTGFWADFIAKLKSEVPNKAKGFFAVEGPVKPQLEGDLLTLVAETDFVKNVVDIPQVLEPAARIASALLGRPMRVRCAKRGAKTASNNDAFDLLLKFSQEHSDVITII